MTSNNSDRGLRVGCKVCVFAGLRQYSPGIAISPTEVCEVVELRRGNRSTEVAAIRRPNGETVVIDADMLGRMNW